MKTKVLPELRVLRGLWQSMLRDSLSLGCSGAVVDALVRRSDDQELVPFLMEALPLWGKAFDAFLLSEGTRRSRSDFDEVTRDTLGISPDNFASFPTSPEVRTLRQLAYLLYKYEVEPTEEQVQTALNGFVKAESEVMEHVPAHIVSSDRGRLATAFRELDLMCINPRHGPGAVAGHEKDLDKYRWGNVPPALLNTYSWEYFVPYSTLALINTSLFAHMSEEEVSLSRVVTVPKDSRGPRVIAVEPKELQWIQQGLMRAMVPYIERRPAFKRQMLFTDQTVNRSIALRGSIDQSYATLDLSEASDRVSHAYVREVFPDHIYRCLVAARSQGTIMPSGMRVMFNKWASMGSAICFPVLSTVCWARLRGAGLSECHIYGDDIAVLGSEAEAAVDALQSIGLKINAKKCCTTGFFRESCGMDAYKGHDVTPIRIKKRWSESPQSAETLLSWCAYAHRLYSRGYLETATFLTSELHRVYGHLPSHATEKGVYNCPSVPVALPGKSNTRTRVNRSLQTVEARVLVLRARRNRRPKDDLLAYHHWLATSPYTGLPVFDRVVSGNGTKETLAVRQEPEGLPVAYYKPKGATLVRAWRSLRVLECREGETPFGDRDTSPFTNVL